MRKRVYEYVGPLELLAHSYQTARFLIQTPDDVRQWVQQQPHDELVATFVVDAEDNLWIADRRSEHIACARGGMVRVAGEIEFEINANEARVVGATNQSTGFCPRVSSWDALERVLGAVGLPHPTSWTRSFEFRRCDNCGELNVVKDEWFVCSNCEVDLPEEWNIGNERSL
ncbi:hypothetical protein IAD21_03137 [Abditibacteriota bacterium]|nr:hypothetical protein IAD21_03137 [Abditibacteriota bacterium]